MLFVWKLLIFEPLG